MLTNIFLKVAEMLKKLKKLIHNSIIEIENGFIVATFYIFKPLRSDVYSELLGISGLSVFTVLSRLLFHGCILLFPAKIPVERDSVSGRAEAESVSHRWAMLSRITARRAVGKSVSSRLCRTVTR